MTTDTQRSVSLERLEPGAFVARNVRGGEIRVGTGAGTDFTPVELLLAAIGGCSAADVDAVTSRRAEPDRFTVRVDADKVRDEGGNILRDIVLTFAVDFPDGDGGDAARQVLPRAVTVSHNRTCTVSRTVEGGVPVSVRLAEG